MISNNCACSKPAGLFGTVPIELDYISAAALALRETWPVARLHENSRPMKRAASSFAIIVLGFVTPACGLFASTQTSTQVASNAPSAATRNSRVVEGAPADTRKVGDFQVHRFSGSYQKSPLTLTEQIIAHENGLWVIDYTFEEQTGTTKLRVRFDPQTDSVARVS